MNKKNKEINCISRLQELTQQGDSILTFLRSESLIKDSDILEIKKSPNEPKALHALLMQLRADNKFQLLEFEWRLLPFEFIRIYMVTDKNQAEFVYDES